MDNQIMSPSTYMNNARAGRADQRSWSVMMARRYGLQVKFDSAQSADSVASDWNAGMVKVMNFDLAWQILSPVAHSSPAWQEENLLLKIVQHGTLILEQHGTTHQFGKGNMVLVDPLRGFKECIREPTRFVVLSIPKQALRNRGLPDNFLDLYPANIAHPDVAVIRDFALFMTGKANTGSERLRERLSDQFLDVMDAAFDDPALSSRPRSGSATILRAKQVIARLAGDPLLNPSRIASELNISANYLTRVLATQGISPMRYAQTLRLERAARLLAETPQGKLHVSEIAYRCGFLSAAHFSRTFKERYGVSPRSFAMNHGMRPDAPADDRSSDASTEA
jgi:AraC-like DNA-binding protein